MPQKILLEKDLNNMLEQLQNESFEMPPAYPHIWLDNSCDNDWKNERNLEEWIKLGKPHVWSIVERVDDYIVLLDTGYGRIALFKNGKFISDSKVCIICDDIVVLDKDYYGTSKYIWR